MIRKIIIGASYNDGCMSYSVGQKFGSIEVDSIRFMDGKGYSIYVSNKHGEVATWKFISIYSPVTLEYYINDF